MKLALHIITLTLGLAAFTACGGDGGGDDGGDDGTHVDAPPHGGGPDAAGGHPTCTVTATATPDLNARTINGVGVVHCTAPAGLELETCVQWNPGGVFADIQCMSSTTSGVAQLEVDNLSSCGLVNGRRFRARVNASVNGTAQPEVLSVDVGCE